MVDFYPCTGDISKMKSWEHKYSPVGWSEDPYLHYWPPSTRLVRYSISRSHAKRFLCVVRYESRLANIDAIIIAAPRPDPRCSSPLYNYHRVYRLTHGYSTGDSEGIGTSPVSSLVMWVTCWIPAAVRQRRPRYDTK